jgi:cholesterol oxidase
MSSSDNIVTLRREWAHLPAPSLDEMVGDLEASFVAPLQRVAPAGLGLVGLPRWYGKRFRREGDLLRGMNLVGTSNGLQERLPMTARPEASRIDGRDVVAVTYADNAPLPWRWIRDELRAAPDGSIVAVTLISARGVDRLGGLPFVLTRAATTEPD